MKTLFRFSGLFLFLFINQSVSLTISGKVTDSITGVGIPSASVSIICPSLGITDSNHTNSSGDWTYSITVGVKNEPPAHEYQFSATRCFPSPFTHSTRINFFLPEPGPVTITFMNSKGEYNASYTYNLDRGAHYFIWNGVARPGIYFIKIATPKSSIIRKTIQLDKGDFQGTIGTQQSAVQNGQLRENMPYLELEITASKLGYVPKKIPAVVQGGEIFLHPLETVHSHAVCADLHNDILEKMSSNSNYHLADKHTTNDTDIPRLKIGGVDMQLFSVWMDPSTSNNYNGALQLIDLMNKELSLNTGTIGQAGNSTEADSLFAKGKIAAVLVAEGGNIIENDLAKLTNLYNKGIRYLTITWNSTTDWAVCAQDAQSATKGLSEFGKSIIRKMDSLGMIIDISHTGIKTIQDILQITKNPIIASHSGAWTVYNHYRNLTDNQIKAIAGKGGVIGVIFYPGYLSSNGSADIAKVIEHIDHVVKVGGIDCVGLGSDFDGVETTATGLEDVSKFPSLTLELLKHGYSRTDVEKILGGNFLRVFRQVCGK